MKTIKITEVIKRLEEQKGISYYIQGGSVVRRSGVWEGIMPISVRSVEQAAAGESHRVLNKGEQLAKRWRPEY